MTTLAIGTPFPRQTLRMQPTNHCGKRHWHENAGTSCSCLSGCHHAIVPQHPLDTHLCNLHSDSTNPQIAPSHRFLISTSALP